MNIIFEGKQCKVLSLKIMNVAGQTVYEESQSPYNGKYSKAVDLKNYPQGVYLLEIKTDKQVVHKKIIRN